MQGGGVKHLLRHSGKPPLRCVPPPLLLQGGGVKRLFRKVDDKSSMYEPNHPGTVRREGSYMYEEFLTTGES